jgi:glycosyltransferase involved in cell wall biosynthesis
MRSVIVCSIVRDCGKALKNNIQSIERICSYFKDYQIIIFENNSKDNTKEVLQKWASENSKVTTFMNDFDERKYLDIEIFPQYNSSNCKRRIQKMVDYRNFYMDYIEEHNLSADYIMIVDLDVTKISVEGVISSFGVEQSWDAIAANGFSLSPKLKRRYHDTYALTEWNMGHVPQTEKMIDDNRYKWNFMDINMPLFPVFSAYGGLSVYRFEAIKNIKYKLIDNLSGGVEVHCEHFGLYKQMNDNGFDKIFINPNMKIHYQKINIQFLVRKIVDLFNSFRS